MSIIPKGSRLDKILTGTIEVARLECEKTPEVDDYDENMEYFDMLYDIDSNYLVISCFPGIGKTTFSRKGSERHDWNTDSYPKEGFPGNYLDDVLFMPKSKSILLVSSHKEVRDELSTREQAFILVYPRKELKAEYLQRYKDAGASQQLIDVIDKRWDNWIDDARAERKCLRYELSSGEYLSDIFTVDVPESPVNTETLKVRGSSYETYLGELIQVDEAEF